MEDQGTTICPYCNQKLSRWESPATYSWGSEYQMICFNDECSYYQKGWDHTYKRVGVKASYRYRYDPNTGQKGPFPVNSPDAGKDEIVVD